MRKLLTLIILTLCFVTGCSKSSDSTVTLSGSTVKLEIPVSEDATYRFDIPKEFKILETDNNVYWKFSEETKFYLTQLVEHSSSEYNEELQLYISDFTVTLDFENLDKSICITTTRDYCDTLSEYLSKGELIYKDLNLYNETAIDVLPHHEDVSNEMKLSSSNLYMPEGVVESDVNLYKAELLCKDNSWLESWIMDGTYSDIVFSLTNICLNNSGEEYIPEWYFDGECLFLKAGNNIIGAKKLRYNEWYIYSGSKDYFNHIITGLMKVHSNGR